MFKLPAEHIFHLGIVVSQRQEIRVSKCGYDPSVELLRESKAAFQVRSVVEQRELGAEGARIAKLE
jgi:hypothetical protein